MRTGPRAEWQQAKRAERDPRELKEIFQDCWAISDSRKAFAHALEARGLYLARGDRRGFVAIDVKGEVYSIAKWTGVKTKQVEAKLGDPAELRRVEDAKAHVAELLSGALGRHLAEAELDHTMRMRPLLERKAALRQAQRGRRVVMRAQHNDRAAGEAKQRAQRLRTGLRGLWDRLTGRHARTRQENEADMQLCRQRDEGEQQAVIREQLGERRQLQRSMTAVDDRLRAQRKEIHRELLDLSSPSTGDPVDTPEPAIQPLQRRVPRRRDGPGL